MIERRVGWYSSVLKKNGSGREFNTFLLTLLKYWICGEMTHTEGCGDINRRRGSRVMKIVRWVDGRCNGRGFRGEGYTKCW